MEMTYREIAVLIQSPDILLLVLNPESGVIHRKYLITYCILSQFGFL